MMDAAIDVVTAGRVAWKRLREHTRATWQDWLTIGRALAVGRTAALKAAGTNRPLGSKYNREIGRWLAANGFDGVNNQERYRIALVLENLPAIESWRAGLDDVERRKYNHPNTVWMHWRRAIRPATPAPQSQRIVARIKAAGEIARKGRAIFWPQHCLRRAHQAMLGSRSHDLLVLARVALQGAIRTEDDLLALLPEPQRFTASSPIVNAVQREIAISKSLQT